MSKGKMEKTEMDRIRKEVAKEIALEIIGEAENSRQEWLTRYDMKKKLVIVPIDVLSVLVLGE